MLSRPFEWNRAMREKRLLERLHTIEDHPDWRGESDPKTAIASVMEHLSKILKYRQGSTPIAADLGMPDFTSIAGSMNADTLPEWRSFSFMLLQARNCVLNKKETVHDGI